MAAATHGRRHPPCINVKKWGSRRLSRDAPMRAPRRAPVPLDRRAERMETLLLFGNVSQPPYCNNLFPPVRAFQRAFRTVVIEPQSYADFVPTGGAKPALIPEDAVSEHTDPPPDVIVCLGGALHFSKRALRSFSRLTALAGFALSDPYGLAASLRIAPEFDLFYTQDPQTLADYASLDIRTRR